MKCLHANNKRFSGVVAALSILISPLATAEIIHTQLEFYDFANNKNQLFDITSQKQDSGEMRLTLRSVELPGKALANDYRLCTNKAGTQGYLRILGDMSKDEASRLDAPVVNFAHEQDLHLTFIPLPNDRRLIYFNDTAVLWVLDAGTQLESSPDCRR